MIAPMHDRMPAILAAEDIDAWLTGTPEEAAALIRPYPEGEMREREVSRAINNPRNETGSPDSLELGV